MATRSPPCGWASVADRAPHQLSLGQRRRVAIATVLAMDPSAAGARRAVREPRPAHAPRAARDCSTTIERTLLVVTHDLPFAAELCERAVILARGRVVADGPCRDVLGDEELLAAHDLELPDGFVLDAIELRPRPVTADALGHEHAVRL